MQYTINTYRIFVEAATSPPFFLGEKATIKTRKEINRSILSCVLEKLVLLTEIG